MQLPDFFDIAVGMMLMMLFLMLITWWQTGDKSYLWYGVFAGGQLAYLLFEHYLDFYAVSDHWEQTWVSFLDFNFPNLIYLGYLGFLERFFGPFLKGTQRLSNLLFPARFLLCLHLAVDLCAWVLDTAFLYRQYFSIFRNVGIVVLATIIITTLRKNQLPAFRLFTLGSLSLVGGGALATLTDFLNPLDMSDMTLFSRQYYFIGNPGFYLALGAITEMLFFYFGFATRVKNMEAEKELAVEKERLRISRDLHDDLGSGIGAIGLLSDIALSKTGDAEMRIEVGKIAESSRDLSAKIREIIWAASARNDTLEKLVGYLHQYAVSLFTGSDIELRAHLPADLPAATVPGERRRAIFLAYKEALNNIVRHAGATRADLQFNYTDQQLTFRIGDNGRGFDPLTVGDSGNGLVNMRQRVEAAGGQFRLESGGNGTVVTFILPF